ncbi:hypothetical protein, partial [uncultured Thiodictyon sp.]|uniref:hypothetical protein n=1 Tax=uncultured Thiodictyon sp. TaxID=1846217 RepID=UPI0025FC406A
VVVVVGLLDYDNDNDNDNVSGISVTTSVLIAPGGGGASDAQPRWERTLVTGTALHGSSGQACLG